MKKEQKKLQGSATQDKNLVGKAIKISDILNVENPDKVDIENGLEDLRKV